MWTLISWLRQSQLIRFQTISKRAWYLNLFFETEDGKLKDFIQKYGGVATMNIVGTMKDWNVYCLM